MRENLTKSHKNKGIKTCQKRKGTKTQKIQKKEGAATRGTSDFSPWGGIKGGVNPSLGIVGVGEGGQRRKESLETTCAQRAGGIYGQFSGIFAGPSLAEKVKKKTIVKLVFCAQLLLCEAKTL